MAIQIPKETEKKVHMSFFRNGALVVEDTVTFEKSEVVAKIPIWHIHMLMQTLVTFGYAKRVHSAGYLYFTITDEGVEFMKAKYYLGAGEVPHTFGKNK